MTRPDLMQLLGQRVTITRPGGSSTWTGTLIAVSQEPCAVIEQDRGPRLCLPQSYAIAPAEEPPVLGQPVPAILTINGTDIHVSGFLSIEVADFDTLTVKGWWADLTFHPLKPPASDVECTIDLGGTIGRGRIAAGSTRMIGYGPPPTIRRAGDPTPEPDIADWERPFVGLPPRHHQPGPDNGARVHGILDRQLDRLAETLFSSIDRLDAHIEQRAAEVAQPLIAKAQVDACDDIERAQHKQQRAEDLTAELRRRIRALENQNERYRHGAAAADTVISELEERAARAEQRTEQLSAAVDRVLKLHHMSEAGGMCVHCSENDYPNYSIAWPCPTVRALDGLGTNRG